MVEKIIINPNKVRGYGNIMNMHTSTDYELSDCTITETTDTVNGATETVYELEDTILFFDPCRTDANQSSGYYVTSGSYSLSDTGLTINASTYASSNYQANIRLDNNVYTVPFEISFDLISCSSANTMKLYAYNNGFSTTLVNGTGLQLQNDTITPIRFIVESNKITKWIGTTSYNISPSTTIGSTVGVRFGYWQAYTGEAKIRNYKVKSI